MLQTTNLHQWPYLSGHPDDVPTASPASAPPEFLGKGPGVVRHEAPRRASALGGDGAMEAMVGTW